MNKERIKELVKEYVSIAHSKFPSLKLEVPEVRFFEGGRVAGTAKMVTNEVAFNLTLAKENPDSFHETVCHEVAHLVTRKVFPRARQNHGPEFKHVDLMMGGRGTRCHSYDTSNSKREVTRTYVVYTCNCMEHDITPRTHQKITMGAGYRCRKCRSSLSPKVVGGKVVTVQKSNKG